MTCRDRTRIFVVSLFILLIAGSLRANDRLTFIYYYAWYGNPEVDGEWRHWTENGHQPPLDLASTFYPKLGPYSSNDWTIQTQHMEWISESGIDVLIYSWWGRNDPSDLTARSILNTAADFGLKVTFLIEPYDNRTIYSVERDIRYLIRRYGNHPAFFRKSRTTGASHNPAARPWFLIYSPEFSDPELRGLSDRIHDSNFDSILLIQSIHPERIEATKTDGIFVYNPADLNLAKEYIQGVEATRNTGNIFIPSVAPGFNKNRLARNFIFPYLSRKKGATYDTFWKSVIAAQAEFVGIVSFNEWHEGTQIEPAIKPPRVKFPYLSYSGAYRKSGEEAEESFLKRTARWISRFQNR